jgi:NADH-quinone oxidoreductase subunit M
MNSFPILSLLIWVPIVTGLGIACASKLDAKLPQTLSALIATVMLALSGLVVSQFMGGDVGFKLQQEIPWITSLGSTYSLGVDSMAAWMILLTSFLGLVAILISKPSEKVSAYFGLLLCLEGTLVGIFSSLDLLLFYVFFELSLVPVALMILGWGTGDRGKVALRYIAVLFAGSLLMLAGIAIIAVQAGKVDRFSTFGLVHLQDLVANKGLWLNAWPLQAVAFWGFMIAFLVKSPAVPVHRWLNDTYEDAPIGAVVAGVVLKVGTFGMFRFCLPLFPEACKAFSPIIVGIGVVGII